MFSWEQRKLGEVVKSYSGGTPTASNKEYYGGDIPFIRSAEINSDTTELYITQKGLDNSSAKIVEKGTILYAMYGATSGEVGISKINGAINQAILAMIPLNYDGKIITQYLRKNKESIIGKYLQGGQGNLSANIILELPIQLPGLEESNQIAYFLESVDNIITLHQRKLEHLKLKKKALLQKLFPKNGERYPELRFPGFTDAWEQRKLGDIATFSKGNGYSKSDLTPSGDPIILYGRLYTNYETTISNVDTFVELKDKSVISQGGEVIVPASGETAEDISRASVVKNQGIIIGGDLNVIKVNHLLDPTFLALTISNGEQQKELSKRAQGKSVVHLHNSDLQEVNLTFPLLNEQKEISTLFEKMDNIITLHQ